MISGPSGVGKGTLVEAVRKNHQSEFYWAKSYTTRPERVSDKTEAHYIFVDVNKFKELEKSGEVLESNFFSGNWYGSSKSEIDRALESGKNILKEVEVNGAIIYKEKYPESVLIFIKADLQNIKSRLINRGQNTAEEIQSRLKIARKEMTFEKDYDYSVVNPEGHPEKAIEEIEKIIKKEIG